jgi:hypothetical protein
MATNTAEVDQLAGRIARLLQEQGGVATAPVDGDTSGGELRLSKPLRKLIGKILVAIGEYLLSDG